MSRRHSAKYKIDRRVGENIWGRPKSPVNKRPNKPGQHGPNRRGKVSDFGMQLMAKQKLKFHYGDITEKQFKATYVEAARRKGNTAEILIGLLEARLDAFVYRSKFVPTIFAARQFVNHGHVTVNGVKTNIGSFRLKAGDVVQVREKSRNMALVLEALGSPERDLPEYIEVDMIAVDIGQVLHLSDVTLPEGVESVALSHGAEHDLAIANVATPKGAAEDEESGTETPDEAEGSDTPAEE